MSSAKRRLCYLGVLAILFAFITIKVQLEGERASAATPSVNAVLVWERTDLSQDQMLSILSRAICEQESSGGRNLRPGDTHRKNGTIKPASQWAYGNMQIRKLCLQDYNSLIARLPSSSWYTLENCKDPAVAYRVFCGYVTYWGSESRLGHKPRMEDWARIWNGGPQGWRRSSTDEYWSHIRAHLSNQNP